MTELTNTTFHKTKKLKLIITASVLFLHHIFHFQIPEAGTNKNRLA